MSTADEIKKLKDLLDAGAITQGEYDNEKDKLLNGGNGLMAPTSHPIGTPVGTIKPVKKKRSGCLVILIIFIGFFCVAMIGLGYQASKNPANEVEEENQIPVLIDATQFSLITEEELIAIMGEPESVEEWVNEISETTGYSMTNYEYIIEDDICYSFEFAKDNTGNKKLVYMLIYFDYNGNGTSLGVGYNEDILKRLGITPNKSMRNEADTGVAIRWSNVADNVYGVWAVGGLADDESDIEWVRVDYTSEF